MIRRGRYAIRRRHIRKLKEGYAKQGWHERYSASELERLFRDGKYGNGDRNGGYQYWQRIDISKRRRYAKRSTNRRIRMMYRSAFANTDLFDVQALTGADYEKAFDYNWEIW